MNSGTQFTVGTMRTLSRDHRHAVGLDRQDLTTRRSAGKQGQRSRSIDPCTRSPQICTTFVLTGVELALAHIRRLCARIFRFAAPPTIKVLPSGQSGESGYLCTTAGAVNVRICRGQRVALSWHEVWIGHRVTEDYVGGSGHRYGSYVACGRTGSEAPTHRARSTWRRLRAHVWANMRQTVR
jgi:hypothetical protein